MLVLKRLWVQITTDKRRLGALCAALVVGLLLWARVIIITNMPRQAVADGDDVAQAETPGADSPVRAPARPVPVVFDEHPRRDPFVINPTAFPRLDSLAGLNPDAGKSDPEPAEDHQRAAARQHAQLRKVVEEFQLDAVMTGLPIAVISGKTYRLGDSVPAIGNEQVRFRLVEVKNRSVILGYEEHRFELTIATPGDQ